MTSTALWTAAGWLLLCFTAANVWAAIANWRKACALEDLADEVLRDRARVIQASRLLESDRESISVFVALNPLARLKAQLPEA